MSTFFNPIGFGCDCVKPEHDGYKGGPCPVCGEFAVGTWRTPNAPVFCRHGHMWMRGEKVLYGGSVAEIQPPQHAPLACPFWGK